MKFHKQVKIPGLSQDQIVEVLNKSDLKMRPMRTKYSWEKKFKTTNTFSDFNIVVEDGLLEVQGGGDYNVWSFVPWVAKEIFGIDKPVMRYTKSDIGYERHGWGVK